MSCANVFDNDTTLVPPTFTGSHPCAFGEGPECNDAGNIAYASANSSLTFNPDGTWVVNGYGNGSGNCGPGSGGPNGVIASGNWITGTFNPADFEIRITGQKRYEYDTRPPAGAFSGCPNPQDPIGYDPLFDNGWQPATSGPSVLAAMNINSTQVCVISVMAVTEFTVQIRQISNPANTVTGSGSVCAEVTNGS